ncbi:MAG: DUF3500 domain-containing protein [Planctomycetes bacterium]|nr:DUF3500 domain-containing protein [Planctomycetota bacterium]
MKKTIAIFASLFLVGVAVYLGRAVPPQTSDEVARAAAMKLYQSLTDDQKKLALKAFSDKDRYTEQFPEVQRPGLPYSKLTAEQKTLVDGVIDAMCSGYGAKRCKDVAKQSSDKGRFINFFGEPSADKPFAWRYASHHLTLIHAEFGKDKAEEFGPILLGGNPVKDLWAEEEKLALELYGSLSEAETKSIQAKGINAGSGGAIGKAGIKIADLNEKSRNLARKLLAKRLEVFAADRRKAAEAIIERDGGVDSLRVAFWNKADKSHLDGGNYHWRIGNDTFVADWQTAGKNHIHMTVRGRAKPAVKS